MIRSPESPETLPSPAFVVACDLCEGSGLCPGCDEDRCAASRRRCADCSGEGDCPGCAGTGSVAREGTAAAH